MPSPDKQEETQDALVTLDIRASWRHLGSLEPPNKQTNKQTNKGSLEPPNKQIRKYLALKPKRTTFFVLEGSLRTFFLFRNINRHQQTKLEQIY